MCVCMCTYLCICPYFCVYERVGLLKCVCCILTFDTAQNAIQGDAPEGSDTFQWQLGEEIAWAEIG